MVTPNASAATQQCIVCNVCPFSSDADAPRLRILGLRRDIKMNRTLSHVRAFSLCSRTPGIALMLLMPMVGPNAVRVCSILTRSLSTCVYPSPIRSPLMSTMKHAEGLQRPFHPEDRSRDAEVAEDLGL